MSPNKFQLKRKVSEMPEVHERQQNIQNMIEQEIEKEVNISVSDDESVSDSEEEVLPYPYNKIPLSRWSQLKKHLKKVN